VEGGAGAENAKKEITSERLGPVSFPQSRQQVFLGRELGHEREHGDSTATAIVEEVRRLLGDIERHARERLEENRDALETLAEGLEERETSEVDDIRELLKGRSGKGRDAFLPLPAHRRMAYLFPRIHSGPRCRPPAACSPYCKPKPLETAP
jgi:hypothetical protein